jgi:argininosuccinate lyase
VTKGIPFRTAHHIVGTLVARCEKENKHALSQLGVEAFNEVIATKSDLRVDAAIFDALGAKNVVQRYQSAGAAGGRPLEEQLKEWKKRLGV